jgi:hypothetical protein
MENKSYLGGGKLGDFIHGLCVCKYVWEKTNSKADLFICNNGDVFEKPLDVTVQDLIPILKKQEWFNSLQIYNNQKIDINLINFRNSPLLYKTSWIDLYFQTFFDEETTPKDYSWIKIPEKDNSLKDIVLINRSIRKTHTQKDEIYKQIIEKHKNCIFVCFDSEQYEKFAYKDLLPMKNVESLYDFFVKLNSCKCYVGNLTGPSAWATSLNIPRVIELPDDEDRNHYLYDANFYTNFKFF